MPTTIQVAGLLLIGAALATIPYMASDSPRVQRVATFVSCALVVSALFLTVGGR